MAASPRARRLDARYTRGLALISVLWMVSLMTVLATTMLAITRANGRMSSRSAQLITAGAAADSAIRLAIVRAYASPDAGPHLRFDTQWQIELFGTQIDVRVEREAGRVDLNATEAPLLAAVFVAGGIGAEQARSFASRIVDWRDADDEPGAGGAELADYSLAKVGHGPRNGPFESVGELQQVLGLAEMSTPILDAFTVYSTRSPTIARDYAHPLVRAALDFLSGAPAGAQSTNSTQGTPSPASVASPLIGQAVRIHACTVHDEVTLCRAAIVRLMSDRQQAVLIHAWYTEQL